MTFKVLFISNISLAPFTTIADRMLVKGLHARGVDITVVTQRQTPETKELEEIGIRIEYILFEKKINRNVIKRLRVILDEGCFDIMHITFSKAMTNCLMAARGKEIKIVGYYGSLSLHWHDPSAWLAFLNRRIDRLICASDAVENHVRKQLPARRRDRTIRIYRGYDPRWFSGISPVTRETIGVSDNDFLICSVGILRRVKGIKYLIDAVKYLPEEMPFKILLIGDGTDSAHTMRLARKSGMPGKFIHKGHLKNPPAWMARCDLYVQPSLSEGLGRAISEAMCMGKPVIVTDGGGAKELFASGDNGFVVRRGSAKALAKAITECWRKKDSLGLVGLKARETMMTTFNHEHTVSQTYDLYCKLLG
jgi:glycosyltransferase involved in cell wall biosynthesis